jgi:hypothetical protein
MRFRALFGFAPFLAFALVERSIGIVPGLVAGLAISLTMMAWDAYRHGGALDILETGSAVVFGGLAILAMTGPGTWSVWEVRLCVDAALALIVFLGVVLGRPFTLQRGRRAVAPEIAETPEFRKHNAILSSIWGLAFAGLAMVDLYMAADAGAPDRRGIILTLAILAAAAKCTQWYVKRIRSAI